MNAVFFLAFLLMCACAVAFVDRIKTFHDEQWRGFGPFVVRVGLLAVLFVSITVALASTAPWLVIIPVVLVCAVLVGVPRRKRLIHD